MRAQGKRVVSLKSDFYFAPENMPGYLGPTDINSY